MRRVMIGTPCHDGKTDVWYNDALNGTLRQALSHGVELHVVYISYDSLVQRARNDLVRLALHHGFDDLVFIDADQGWEPEQFYKLLSHPIGVVGAAVPKKSDTEIYNVRINDLKGLKFDKAIPALIEVDGIGTGMLRLSRGALQGLWDSSTPYMNEGREGRWIFDVKIVDGQLVSEDNVVCTKLKNLGFSVYVDRTITCSHVGPKKWVGDFDAYLEKHFS